METTNQQPEMEMTPEQLAEQKEKMLEFYRESMPYLRAQLDYEKMLLEIDETRFKRSSIQYQFAMMMNPQDKEELEESDDLAGSDFDVDNANNTSKRKLKRN
jgi:hypothetical protein